MFAMTLSIRSNHICSNILQSLYRLQSFAKKWTHCSRISIQFVEMSIVNSVIVPTKDATYIGDKQSTSLSLKHWSFVYNSINVAFIFLFAHVKVRSLLPAFRLSVLGIFCLTLILSLIKICSTMLVMRFTLCGRHKSLIIFLMSLFLCFIDMILDYRHLSGLKLK